MPQIDRNAIKNGLFQQMAKEAEELGLIRLTSAAERELNWRTMLRTNPNPCGNVWVFAYGSLLWNPAFNLIDSCEALLEGFHRDFILRTYIGRGNLNQPGLVLGLEEGGVCQGQALLMDPDGLEEELDILWSREMMASAYEPRWLPLKTGRSAPIHAIAFVMDTGYDHYAGHLSFEEKCHDLAHGKGALGCAASYLFDTVKALHALGISDPLLDRCAQRVREIQSQQQA